MKLSTLLQTALPLFAASAALAQAPAVPNAQPAAVPPTTPRPKPHVRKAEAASTNFNLIVLDPAHGGSDKGAVFPDNVVEAQVTLALANVLRPMLAAQGFTVVMTRENSTEDVSSDTRVEQANRSHAVACLLLHAANGGHGVHLYTSALTPPSYAPLPDDHTIQPWDTAQAAELAQSTNLQSDLQSSLNGIRVPIVTGRVSVLPLDSLTCPAVALEIASIAPNGDVSTPVNDPGYQQHVAQAVTAALVSWRAQAQSAASAAAAKAAPVPPAKDLTGKPKATPRPRPVIAPGDGSVPPAVVPPPPARRTAPKPAPAQPASSPAGGPA